MQNESNAAAWGAVAGALVGLSALRKGLDDDTERARRKATDAQSQSRAALTRLQALLASGFMLRGLDHRVADFELGQAYPGNADAPNPSAFLDATQSIARPQMTEALAVAPQQWPPSTNAYNDNGLLTHPAEGLVGQNVATGLVLGYAENRAFLLGLPGSAHPSSFTLAQYFRLARGLGSALAGIAAGSAPLGVDDYQAAFLRLFQPGGAPASGYASGLVFAALADGAAYGNSTSETALASVVVPKDLLAVGESAEVVFGEVALGAANLTTRVRLDSLTGTVLHQTLTAISTQGTLRQTVNITRRADVGGNQVYEIISESGAAATDVVSWVPGFDHTLVLTGVWSAAAVGNTVTAKLAQLRKL